MKTHKGLSLVELMVALALGSLVTIATTQLFLVNRQTENLQLGIASVQENGRFVFDYLSRQFMSAGYSEGEPIVPFVVDGTSFNNLEIDDGTKFDTVVFEVLDGQDCLGNALTGFKKFYVKNDALGNRLVCTAYEKNAADPEAGTDTDEGAGESAAEDEWSADDSGPLVDNVEAFQVLYGIDFDRQSDEGYGYANVYTNAQQTKALFDGGEAVRIVSVRFAILIASDSLVTLDNTNARESIDVLDQSYVQGEQDGKNSNQINFADGRMYRTYGATVALRNVVEQL